MMVAPKFPGLALGFSVVFSALAASAEPPPALEVPAWADAKREIPDESGARITGKWDSLRAPYMYWPMLVAGVDHPAATFWMRWGAKTGKTQVPLNAIFHCIDTAPRSIMVVCPSDQKQRDFEKEVFTPALKASKDVSIKVKPVTSRSGEGSTVFHKRFRGGFLKIINGASEGQLQQSDIGFICYEEPSSYPRDVGGRGPTVRQARARNLAWGDDAKEVGAGTPKTVGDCVVTEEVESRTLHRYYVPCPDCGARQVLKWENMTRDAGRPYFICQACGVLIGHEHKNAMNLAAWQDGPPYWGWIPCFTSENPDNPAPPDCFPAEELDRWRFRDLEGRDPSADGIWQGYSPFSTWRRVFTDWDEANKSGDPADLATFSQQTLGLPFEASHERPSVATLYEGRKTAAAHAGVTPGRMPDWAYAVYLAVDLQGDRFEHATWAQGPGNRWARIDRGVIPIPPVSQAGWQELSQLTTRQWEGTYCKPIGYDRIGVDTGGHHTNQAYIWCSGRPNVMAMKGKPNDRGALPISLGTKRKARIGGRIVAETQLYLVGTHALKKDVYFGLSQTVQMLAEDYRPEIPGLPLPGSVVLEATATEVDFAQITAEVLLPPAPAKGKEKARKEEEWHRSPKGAPNEQLDLCVLAMAMGASFVPQANLWDILEKNRRRDPLEIAAAGPLEALMTGAASAPGDASAARLPVRPEDPARGPAEPPAATIDPDHPLMRLARRNRGEI